MIKVGYCVAYDWQLLYYSIPQVYAQADVICLSLDKNRLSWSGTLFSWDEAGFRSMLKNLDPDGKIVVYEDDFYDSRLQPMQNEVAQRSKMASYLGDGGWHLQLDADEFFLNFKGFVQYLRQLKPQRNVNVCCPWITLYKQTEAGFFYVHPQKFREIEFIQIATQRPKYEYGRRNGYFNIYCSYAILHLSWARSKAEIWEKLNSWGHSNDFDISTYFNQWQLLDQSNYMFYKNFHHLKPEAWPALNFVPARSISDLMDACTSGFQMPVTHVDLAIKNSIWLSRFKSLFLRFR